MHRTAIAIGLPSAVGKDLPQMGGGRIANYRTGDRAEWLGMFLTQSLCAVAPVPREDDFGLFDAVAALLRPDALPGAPVLLSTTPALDNDQRIA